MENQYGKMYLLNIDTHTHTYTLNSYANIFHQSCFFQIFMEIYSAPPDWAMGK